MKRLTLLLFIGLFIIMSVVALNYSPDQKEHAKKPGPGAYDGDVLKTRKQDPQYKLGTGQRLDLAFQKKYRFQ